ncbi:MAG: hypothetical protein MUF87_10455 [Anaerolineae bacterium]|jgi:hypothetical protein|nr:hypothetical protein [Anaerolineae bacterium]
MDTTAGDPMKIGLLRFISRLIIGLFIAFIVLIGVAIVIGRTIPRELEIALVTSDPIPTLSTPSKLHLLSAVRRLQVIFTLSGDLPRLRLRPERYTFGVTMVNTQKGLLQHAIFTPRQMIPYPTLDHLYDLVWLSDGSTLQVILNPSEPDLSSVYWVRPDQAPTLWFRYQGIHNMILSPDERWIVFNGVRQGEGQDTYLYDHLTQQVRPFNPAAPTFFYEIAWSPDSQWLAAVSTNPNQPVGILIGRPSDQDRTRLIDPAQELHRSPTWSPDQQRVAFAMNNQIYVIRRDGTDLRWLNFGIPLLGQPIWLPDGQMLITEYANQMELLMIDPDHLEQAPRRLFTGNWIQILVIP